MEQGNKYKIHIESYSHEGYGVGKVEGMVVMIPDSLIGEECDIYISEIKNNYAMGYMKNISLPSINRQTPFCKYFKECGGCDIQHMTKEESLSFKKNVVKNALTRIGKLEIPSEKIKEIAGMEEPYKYRNIAQYHMDAGGNVGFYKKGTNEVIDIDYCPIQSDIANSLVIEVKNILNKNNIESIRHIIIRTSFSTKEAMLILSSDSNIDQFVLKNAFLPDIVTLHPECSSIYLSYKSNKDKSHKAVGDRNILLYGKESITDNIGEHIFNVSPQSFFQVNAVQTKVLYGTILKYANLNGTEYIYDIYCGAGTISIFLSQSSKHVVGVESVKAAVIDARKNANLNGADNVSFVDGRAEVYMPSVISNGEKCDVIVLDPPRAGCDRKVLDSILKVLPERVIYVSCNPATLARDLKILCEEGKYEAAEVRAVDMFPWTKHVEAVVLLERKAQ